MRFASASWFSILLRLQPGEDVLVRNYAPGIRRGDALFDGLDKPPPPTAALVIPFV